MFGFVVKYLSLLKFVPGLPLLFDALLKLYIFAVNPSLLDLFDEVETKLLTWTGVTAVNHKYGGRQYNYRGKELGHIHGNGLLDLPLSRMQKEQLKQQYHTVTDHHVFKNSGWVSVCIKSDTDVSMVLHLFKTAYELRRAHSHKNGSA